VTDYRISNKEKGIFILTKIQVSQVARRFFRLLAKLELKIIPTCQRTNARLTCWNDSYMG
ncbi:hypothetical protein, partial [Bacteroides cellulosilyticus]|uniref:hypothetical protein n=1 Tax=Bacteroides cellulosilyticus TaxID=246787 RepID=UPI0034A219F3